MRYRYAPMSSDKLDLNNEEMTTLIIKQCLEWMYYKSADLKLPIIKFNILTALFDLGNKSGMCIEVFFGDENV